MTQPEPVFIHSFPRAASTWFGTKVKAHFGDAYFYEPSHEIMIDGTHEQGRAEYDRLKQGKSLRHPPIEEKKHLLRNTVLLEQKVI